MRAHKVISALSVLALTTLGSVVAAPAAHAGGYGCGGNLVWSAKVTDIYGGEAGWLYDYWDGSDNCSVFVKTEYAGTKTWTNLSIHNSAGVSGGHDYGYFSTYAGPVRVPGVGVCVSEFVAENDLNGNQIVNWMSGSHGC